MTKSVVFVLGASGMVGKATVNALSKNFGEKLDIRAGVRNPAKVPEFKSLQGVKVVQAEMSKRDELLEAFKDVDVLFIVAPSSLNRLELITTAAEAAKDAGVKHFLTIGTPIPTTRLGKQMMEIENIIINIGQSYTILQLPWFMDNYFAFKQGIKKSSEVRDNVDPTKRFAAIAMDDLGLAAAVIMSSPEKHKDKKYLMVSERHTFNDLVKAFSETLGKDVKYVQQSFEELRSQWLQRGVSEWHVDGLIEYFTEVNSGTYEEQTDHDNDFTVITGKPSTSLAAWVQKYANVFK